MVISSSERSHSRAREEVETAKTILFVYGTLKRGEPNAFRMAGQEFLGEAVTAAKYRVIDLGPYPGLVRDAANGLAVRGELYAVDAACLAALDEFEGVAGPFVRELIEVVGYEVVWVYYMSTPIPEGAKSGDRWPLS
jgi:gamma-glutamylaminecyclotransferase